MKKIFLIISLLSIIISCDKSKNDIETITSVDKKEEIDSDTIFGVCTTDILNIRENPVIESDKIGYLENNEQVEILERTYWKDSIDNIESYWYQIKKENVIGWAFGGYINLISNIGLPYSSSFNYIDKKTNENDQIIEYSLDYGAKIKIIPGKDTLSLINKNDIENIEIDPEKEYFIEKITYDKYDSSNSLVKISTLRYPLISGFIKMESIDIIPTAKPKIISGNLITPISQAYNYHSPTIESGVSGSSTAGRLFFVTNSIINERNEEWLEFFSLADNTFPPIYYSWGLKSDYSDLGIVNLIDPQTEKDPNGIYFDLNNFSEGDIDPSVLPVISIGPKGFGDGYGYPPENATIVFSDYYKTLLFFDITEKFNKLSIKATSPDSKVYENEFELDINLWLELFDEINFDNDGIPVYKIPFVNHPFFKDGIWNFELTTDTGKEYFYSTIIHPSVLTISTSSTPNPLDPSIHVWDYGIKNLNESKQGLYIWGIGTPFEKTLVSLYYMKPSDNYLLNYMPIISRIAVNDENGFYKAHFLNLIDIDGEVFLVIGENKLQLYLRNGFYMN